MFKTVNNNHLCNFFLQPGEGDTMISYQVIFSLISFSTTIRLGIGFDKNVFTNT